MSCLEEKRESENEESELDDARKTHGGIVQAIDLNVRLHDSKISNEEIYKQLELVDQQSAQKIHPNDRRKLCR